MFWRAFGLALLAMVAVGGISGTVTFGVLYNSKASGLNEASASATSAAAFDEGFQAGERSGVISGESTAAARANACDRVVGGTATGSFQGHQPGDLVSLTLTIQSAKTGSTYEVQTPAICKIADDLKTCNNNIEGYAIGNSWPVGCR